MAGGWAQDGAVQDQIDTTVADAVALARARLQAAGAGRSHCECCDDEIPLRRREAIPGVRLCVRCQEAEERGQPTPALFNRRGSKDSQLR